LILLAHAEHRHEETLDLLLVRSLHNCQVDQNQSPTDIDFQHKKGQNLMQQRLNIADDDDQKIVVNLSLEETIEIKDIESHQTRQDQESQVELSIFRDTTTISSVRVPQCLHLGLKVSKVFRHLVKEEEEKIITEAIENPYLRIQ
jgi:hypothetical protein